MEKELLKIEGKKEVDKKQQPKKVSKVGGLAAKLSPKSQRKKETGQFNIAQLKVQIKRSLQCARVSLFRFIIWIKYM